MEKNSPFFHNIYKNDPLLSKNYVGNEVSIITEDGNTNSGIVYTVDPVSESVVLLQINQPTNIKIVFGHAIKSIEVCSEKTHELNELFMTTPSNILRSTFEERKNAVTRMLEANLFHVKEDNDVLVIENILSISPPYEASNCICENSIILGRIQNLLSRVQINNLK